MRTPLTEYNDTSVIVERTSSKGQAIRLEVVRRSNWYGGCEVIATIDGQRIDDGMSLPIKARTPITGPDGRLYTHGVGRLGLTTDEADRLIAVVTAERAAAEQRLADEKAAYARLKREGVAARATAPIIWTTGSGYGGREYRIGETVRHDGQVVTVISVETRGGFGENAISVGAGEDDGTLHTTWARPATAEEIAAHEAMEAEGRAEREAEKARRRAEYEQSFVARGLD